MRHGKRHHSINFVILESVDEFPLDNLQLVRVLVI
jgi:hypothetical protein